MGGTFLVFLPTFTLLVNGSDKLHAYPHPSLLAVLGAAPNYAVIVFSLLYLLASIYVYISLIRQISARTSAPVGEPTKRFGLPEAILAAALIGFLLLNIRSHGSDRNSTEPAGIVTFSEERNSIVKFRSDFFRINDAL